MNKMLMAACLLACGDYAGLTYPEGFAVWGLAVVLVGMGLGAVLVFKPDHRVVLGFFLSFAFFLGAVLGAVANGPLPVFWQRAHKKPLVLRGNILPGSVERRQWDSLGLVVVENKSGKGIQVLVTGWPQKKPLPEYGRVEIRCQLEPLRGFANPGALDTVLQGRTRNIWARTKIKAGDISIKQDSKPLTWYFVQIAKKWQERIGAVMSRQDAGIICGMVLGGSKNIAEETLEKFATAGLLHLLAVSGTHVAILGGGTLALTRGIGLPIRWSALVAACVIVFYAMLCDLRPAVVRAALMGVAALGGVVMERKGDRSAIFGGTLALSLIYNPWLLLNIGFQLSFLATAGLLYLLPVLTGIGRRFLPYKVAVGVALPLAAQLPLLPLLLTYFHQLSILSLVSNLLLMPLLAIVLLLTLGGLFLGTVFPLLGRICLVTGAQILAVALEGVNILTGLPVGSLRLQQLTLAGSLGYYLCLFTAFKLYPISLCTGQKRRLFFVVSLAVLLGAELTPRLEKSPYTVYFLDVGQGDCALVHTPKGICALVDTGGLEGDFNTGTKLIAPVLSHLGISRINALILSHGHRDHCGGAAGLARNFPPEHIFLPWEPPSPEVLALLKAAPKAEVHRLKAGSALSIGDLKMTMLTAPEQRNAPEATNDSCGFLKLTCAGNSILFTGDTGQDAEQEALGLNIQAQVLKLGHHGSKFSSSGEFLDRVKPLLAVASCGYKNKFGHPHKETWQRLAHRGIKAYRTDRDGAVGVFFWQGGIGVKKFRKRPEGSLET